MLSIHGLINELNKNNVEIPAFFGNKNIMEISKSTKRKPAFIKISINDEMAEQFLCFPMKAIALFIALPQKEFEEIISNYKNKG